MRGTVTVLTAAAFVSCCAVGAGAQGRSYVPWTGQTALSVGTGVAMPSDNALDSGLEPRVGFDYYATPRFSVRLQGGAAWNDYSFGTGERVRRVFVDINGVYNWELVRVHPFVTAGFGAYSSNVEQFGSSITTTRPGYNAGGGVEYFLNGFNALRGEVAYHGVSGVARGPLSSFDPSFWSASVAFKHYF